MASATTISTIVIEPEVVTETGSDAKEKFAKRFKPSNLNKANPSNNRKQVQLPASFEYSLRPDDIKEHRLWVFGSLILCFFLIAPIIAFYHSRRIRKMKKNQELTRAKSWSDRVKNMLIISNIIGAVIWVALLFIIGVLFIFGAVY